MNKIIWIMAYFFIAICIFVDITWFQGFMMLAGVLVLMFLHDINLTLEDISNGKQSIKENKE